MVEKEPQSNSKKIVDEVVRRYHQAVSTSRCEDGEALNFILVHNLLKDAVDEAIRIRTPAVIAIVDAHGNLIITYRMPDAMLVSIDVAPKKAYTAVAMKKATHELTHLTQSGGEFFQLEASMAGKIMVIGGGYPLYIDGKLVGGLGVSGGSVAEDRQIAEAALKRFHQHC